MYSAIGNLDVVILITNLSNAPIIENVTMKLVINAIVEACGV